MSSLAMPGLCFMGAYQYYSSGFFHIFAKNPLPDLGLLLLLSASPLILLRKEQPFAFRLVLSLILILFATVFILSAKKGPLVSLLAISFCLIYFNFRKYYKFLLFLVVLAGLFLNFSTGAMQKFKGTALGIANLIFVEPDYSRIIYDQIWTQDQAQKYVWKTWSDLNKTASSALPLEERAKYKKMLKDRNSRYIYHRIWDVDHTGSYQFKSLKNFDQTLWNSLSATEQETYREMFKARREHLRQCEEGQWLKVDSKTKATSLETLNAMPDKHLLENNLLLRYWNKLDQDSFPKMQAKLAIMKKASMQQIRNEIPVVNHYYEPQKKHFSPSTTETILGPIPPLDTKNLWSFTLRIEHYFFAFHLFKKSPIWGLGFKANLEQHLEDYQPNILSLRTINNYKGYVKWHQTFENIILMHLVERGGLFTFTYFGGIAYILIGCAKEIRTYPQENIAGMLTIIILTGFLVLSLTFDTLRFPSLNWIFHSLLGLLINLVTKRSHENSKNSLRL
jgi:hypothetical protein